LARTLPDAQPFLQEHDGVQHARELMGDELSRYLSFAFVRNPFDRLASWYRLLRWQDHLVGIVSPEDFERFVMDCLDRDELPASQLSCLCDEDHEILVDEWGRFENLEAELRRILARRGLETPRMLHLNAGPVASTERLYSDQLRRVIALHYAEDFDRFGYAG
jgi:hypothetical protein